MEAQFRTPPDVAKPRVWWHWMNGNVAEAGITADLQWMNRVGIGGVHLLDAGLNSPQWIQNRIPYMSPGWKKAFSYSVNMTAKIGMEFGVFSSPGWSITGGPWVTPEQAMKKLVWSELTINGGKLFKGTLPNLPITTGPFQHVPRSHRGHIIATDASRKVPEYHQDTIVIAYREPSVETNTPPASLHSNFVKGDLGALTDKNSSTSLTLPPVTGKKNSWIKMDYGQPFSVRSITVAVSPPGSFVNLSVSNDGKKFRKLKTFYMGPIAQVTVDFEPVTARYFRFSFHSPRVPTDFFLANAVPGASRDGLKDLFGIGQIDTPPIVIHDLILRQAPRVNHFEKKAGFAIARDYYAIDTSPVAKNLSVAAHDVIDLTELMQDDGYLEWDAPPGNWVVLRMGYSLTGSMNHAASKEGTGLEVDKLNRRHVQQYMDTYLQSYEAILGPKLIGKRGLNAFMTDSFEVGLQNWTDDILLQFERLRGYDPLPWLPSLTGIVVESAEQSDKFLWDFRKTIADLILHSHYKVIAETARAYDLTLYGEGLESMRFFLGDDMNFRRYADVPTAAMWMFSPEVGPQPGYSADIRGAASVAHVYGKEFVAAESLTTALAPWASAPRDLKPVVDLEFALGVNRLLLHSSVHQPRSDKQPGLSLSIFGQNFNRHETWAEQAKDWISYLARSSYLLQQGDYVADIAYFYGEEAPASVLFNTAPPAEIPRGYGYDFVSADAILTQMSVVDGSFMTLSGMSYRVLYLGGTSERMTLPVLRKLQKMVAAGGVVIGAKPVATPSLTDNELDFHRITDAMWGSGDSGDSAVRKFGEGYVFTGTEVDMALDKLHVAKDFDYAGGDRSTQLLFNHRKLLDTHIYFVSNRSDRPESLDASFRVRGKAPQFWYADDGRIEEASFQMANGKTVVPLDLGPFESIFVVFRENTTERSYRASEAEGSTVASLDEDWQLSFTPKAGAPVKLEPVSLGSWSEQKNQALKYFSGTASYIREIDVPDSWLSSDSNFVLDLGDVRELAEVIVNSQPLGTLWKPPYRVDVSKALRAGRNIVEVKVTNLWVNQLIGDQRPGTNVFSATGTATYLPNAMLKQSGLIGPVIIEEFTAK